jgi:hypothetical protein
LAHSPEAGSTLSIRRSCLAYLSYTYYAENANLYASFARRRARRDAGD